MGDYLTGQVCKNGHFVTRDISYGLTQQCGAPTITHCPFCSAPIHGDYFEPGIISIADNEPDAYCYHCGKPYPWTESRLESMRMLIEEEEALSDDQKKIISESLPDIVSETPATKLASVRIKKALVSAGQFTADALRQFVIDFGCELAKKSILP